MNVAVITRSLRADACMAYMSSVSGNSRYAILTADAGAFARDQRGAKYEVRRLSTGPLPVDQAGIAMATRRKLLGWARSGSRIGQLVESVARTTMGARRRVAKPAQPAVGITSRNEQLYDQLVEINREERIEQIYVFDLFDLPTTLEFSADFGTKVVVR